MLPRATENAVAGYIWPAGRYLPTPGLRLFDTHSGSPVRRHNSDRNAPVISRGIPVSQN